ncbi:hypothetical protein C8E03_101742 [Lachnotalea glycerini]|uniref:Uncharacterized protein n=1 Tax=Lachnotalea glycerini TaxID=1763509 RepID=A0A318ET75_9FIRM|nr:hypothetical protein [Lachnotalea glycerini]PXV96109.1 hypothetical protein C8E03_101742 [Lachnotalea glycerini]
MKKYYKDYTADLKVTDDGKIVRKVKYVGDYYEYRLDEKEYRKMRGILFGTVILDLILFVLAGLLNSDGSFQFYILLPYMFSLLPMIFLLWGYISIPKKKKIMEYSIYDKSFLRVKFSLVGILAAGTVTTLSDIIYIVSSKNKIHLLNEIGFCIFNLIIVILSMTVLFYHNCIVCNKRNA